MVAIDFSVYSRSAVRHAQRFFPHSRLTLLHAYQVPFKIDFGTEEYVRHFETEAGESFKSFILGEMDALIFRAAREAVDEALFTPRLVEGIPADVIRAEQAGRDADLVVIGTHSSSGMVRAIWGSVARNLLDDPPCDVLVVHGL